MASITKTAQPDPPATDAPLPALGRPGPSKISRSLLGQIGTIAAECDANAILLCIDAISEADLPLPTDVAQDIFYVTKRTTAETDDDEAHLRIIRIPNVAMTRMGQIKIAVVLALSRGLINRGDILVCASGMEGSGTLDTLVVMQVGREFQMIVAPNGDDAIASEVAPEVLERVIDLAAQLGHEGREGRPVGALFVVGDTERVLSLARQLILNPFRGYPEEQRNILDPALEETVKELATIDGAFLVRGDGVIESAGAYLKTAAQDELQLPQGLGARHHSAAGITAVSEAVAITVSESTGTVTIFRKGKIITDIEKPRNPNHARKT